jgi:hypothetical protein
MHPQPLAPAFARSALPRERVRSLTPSGLDWGCQVARPIAIDLVAIDSVVLRANADDRWGAVSSRVNLLHRSGISKSIFAVKGKQQLRRRRRWGRSCQPNGLLSRPNVSIGSRAGLISYEVSRSDSYRKPATTRVGFAKVNGRRKCRGIAEKMPAFDQCENREVAAHRYSGHLDLLRGAVLRYWEIRLSRRRPKFSNLQPGRPPVKANP